VRRAHLFATAADSAVVGHEFPSYHRWQRSIPVGHFCEGCLLARVRTAMAATLTLPQVKKRSGHTAAPVGCRAQDES